MTIYLKALNPRRHPINGGQGQWPYRKWTEPITHLEPCRRGYHIATPQQILTGNWLPNTDDCLWLVEPDPFLPILDRGDKTVVARARLIRRLNWTDYTARMFAADCAEHVLHIYETKHPDDPRPREAIQAARDCATGTATASAAAWATGTAAARDAASAAARWAARDAAWDAARWAASAAARWAAAVASVERDWQAQRLMQWIDPKHQEATP